MEIHELVENVKANIEDSNIRNSNVGNRPHFPSFITFYGSSSRNCLSFINTLKNIWSGQICKNLLFYRYDIVDSKLEFKDVNSEDIIVYDYIYDQLSNVGKVRDVFKIRKKWCTYNILDTSNITFEKFLTVYNSLDQIKSIVDESIQSMVIIILNGSRSVERKKINYQIRKYLTENSVYDSTIVVSDRARGSLEIDSKELYGIISNLVLLSNNDAVSSYDDESYMIRTTKIYSKKPLLLSYNSLSKPIDDILYCMIDRLLDSVYYTIEKHTEETFTLNELNNILGIENGKLSAFEQFVESVKSKVSRDLDYSRIIQYLPMRSPQVYSQSDIIEKPISQLNDLYYDTLVLIAKQYCCEIIKSEEGKHTFENYKESINQKLNIVNASYITYDMVESTFKELLSVIQTPSRELNSKMYLQLLVVYILQKDFIIPYCQNLSKNICDKEKKDSTRKSIDLLLKKLDDELPISGFDDIPRFYGDNMSQYLNTDDGKKQKNDILKIGNTFEDLIEIVEQTLHKANNYCNESIKLPFIKVWANTLKLHPGEIFTRIRTTLLGDGNDGILLKGGEYPINDSLSVFMLHCYDRDGNNPTPLYKQFTEAYKDMNNVQFFNTGNDDSIKSIKFFECSGNNLIIGLKDYE